jgi:predicted nucleic acid-binding protein
MSKLVLLDTGILGLAANPKALVSGAVLLWLKRLLREGHNPIVPEIADYELRRELIRIASKRALAALDRMNQDLNYLPIDTETMRRAAELWAQSRAHGRPLAHEHALDGDVILCAQAQLLAEASPQDEVIIATTNVEHLRRFAEADEWQNI